VACTQQVENSALVTIASLKEELERVSCNAQIQEDNLNDRIGELEQQVQVGVRCRWRLACIVP